VPRAIVFNGDETWEERNVPVPKLRPGCAVLRVEATGICHSDLDQFRGHPPVPSGGVFPVVPGHEVVGRIEKITPDAAAEFRVQEGDRVGVRSLVVMADGTRRVYGFDFPFDEASGLFGGYADYMELVPGSEVSKLRDDLPATELSVYECLTNAITWIRSVRTDDVLVVEGPGHMGLAALVGAKAAGVRTVIVTGLSQDRARLDTALRLGADHAIDVEKEDVVARVAEITGGAMADVVLDAASGNPVTLTVAMDLVRTGGTVIEAGMEDRPLDSFDVSKIPPPHHDPSRRRARPARRLHDDQRGQGAHGGTTGRVIPARAVRRRAGLDGSPGCRLGCRSGVAGDLMISMTPSTSSSLST